ncbi:MAG: transglutaminase family protein [Acidimicrobiia bacterium]|nr:transglutaminase family protein [Acidimicrobiia bacterium]
MTAPTRIDPAWLSPTWFIDADSPQVEAFAAEVLGGPRPVGDTDPVDTAIKLFYAVRDGLRYDPYGMDRNREAFRASHITGLDSAWCVTKSILFTAAARNQGIPARLGFADVRNHLSSEKLLERLGTDLFIWHGYSELLLNGRWFKLSTAFNIELCDRFGVKALDFDGTDDALMHPFDKAGNRHMEYVNQRGSYNDLPYDQILSDFAALYPAWGGEVASSAESAGDDAFSV